MEQEDNVVKFPGVEEIEYAGVLGDKVEVEEMLNAALEHNLENVVISGTTKDGAMYFASTSGDPKDILWEIERAKALLMLSYFANSQGED